MEKDGVKKTRLRDGSDIGQWPPLLVHLVCFVGYNGDLSLFFELILHFENIFLLAVAEMQMHSAQTYEAPVAVVLNVTLIRPWGPVEV